MGVELIGLIIVAVGGLALLHSARLSFTVFAIAALLQAAAAILMGGANITPGHLALGFFVLAILIRQGGLAGALQSVVFPRPGFWLLLATLWGVFSAIIMPRLFFGQFEVYPLGIMNSLGIIAKIPLSPVGSNINQSIYWIGNLFAFMAVASMARSPRMMDAAAKGVLAMIIANLALVLIDQFTFAIGAPQLLDFIRNAEYGQLFHATVLGMKRITGSFPEASSYATIGMGLFAFALRLWRGGVMPTVSGWLALAMFVTLLLSTSSTAYIALAPYLAVVYMTAVAGTDPVMPGGRKSQSRRGVFISFGPLAVLGIACLLALRPDLMDGIGEFFDQSLGSKLQSDSGEERTRWNLGGIEAILSTYGLGAGLGSVRTSSFLLGLPANVGLFGALLFGLFLYGMFDPERSRRFLRRSPQSSQIAAAGRSACFGILLAAIASGGTADLGLVFFIFAGLASATAFYRGQVPATTYAVPAAGDDVAGPGGLDADDRPEEQIGPRPGATII